jgi:ADP-heptose:LPS heptosyltransferase
MNIDLMKKVDRVAGGFGCLAMDAFDRVRRIFSRRRGRLEGVRTILITKYLGMGSIVLASPFVAQVRRRFPGARLVFLSFEENRDIVGMLGLFDEHLFIRSKRLHHLALDSLRALWRCWSLGIDLVFDLEFFTRYSALIAYLSGAPNRVGYWSRISWRGDLLTHPVYYNGTKHIARVFLALAEAVGQAWDERPLEPEFDPLVPDAGAGQSLEAKLRGHGLDLGAPLLLVNPNASPLCLERRWMPERFAAVVDGLVAKRPRLQTVFLGSASEAGHTRACAALCRSASKVAVMAGELSLQELVALLQRGQLLLTNDSGPLHLAALAGTPTVALFGPETPTLYGPIGKRQTVFYAGVYCSPCLNVFNSKTAPCNGNNICMQAIQAEAVLSACDGMLAA